VAAVSLLNGLDPPQHFKQHIFYPHFNPHCKMLLAHFTLHKVRKYFSDFGLRGKEDITWLSLGACDPPEVEWRDTDS
jgi:hypothetical protein